MLQVSALHLRRGDMSTWCDTSVPAVISHINCTDHEGVGGRQKLIIFTDETNPLCLSEGPRRVPGMLAAASPSSRCSRGEARYIVHIRCEIKRRYRGDLGLPVIEVAGASVL